MELFIVTRTVDHGNGITGTAHLETHVSIASAVHALHEYTNDEGIRDAVQTCIDNDWDKWYDFQEVRWEKIDGMDEMAYIRLGIVTYQITRVEIDV